jgi:phosphoribosylformylglycinamidine synthase
VVESEAENPAMRAATARDTPVVAIQDMGAAGLTSSSFEMCARGGVGMRLDLSKVPVREVGMTPYELMLSESQERMLLVAERGREDEVMRVFRKWGVDVEVIGEVTAPAPDGPRMVLEFGGKVVADLAIAPLVDDAPVYERPFTPPDTRAPFEGVIDLAGAPPDDEALLALLACPNLSSKKWITTQYDWSVRTNTVAGPGGDAAVLRVSGTNKGLAVTADVNPRWVAADPYRGAAHAVAEAALNVACAGALPIGVTDCLNFGNPERPEILGQLAAAVRGLGVACRVFDTPVVSGNVSLYNETEGRSILPTPTVGMVGVLDDVSCAVGIAFRREGNVIALLGETRDELGASEYLATVLGRDEGPCPSLDLLAAKALVSLLVELARDGLVSSAHDVSTGGRAVALSESCFGPGDLGADVNVQTALLPTPLLFAESAHRAVISFEPGRERLVLDAARRHGVPTALLGRVTAGSLRIAINGEPALDRPVAELRNTWASSFVRLMEETV